LIFFGKTLKISEEILKIPKSLRVSPTSAPWNGFGFGSGMDLDLVFPQELSGTTIWIWKKESDPDSKETGRSTLNHEL